MGFEDILEHAIKGAFIVGLGWCAYTFLPPATKVTTNVNFGLDSKVEEALNQSEDSKSIVYKINEDNIMLYKAFIGLNLIEEESEYTMILYKN
jgi:hypothetical protein